MGQTTQFYCKPRAGEQVETCLHLSPDLRPAISGVVLGEEDRPVENALVLLFEAEGRHPLAQGYTDPAGRFAFGPLSADTLYLVRVYRDSIRLRELELRL